MTENIEDLLANGSAFPSANTAVGGFDTADGWDSHYIFRDAEGNVTAEGDIPMPSQPKIDNFQRSIAKLLIELDAAEQQEREAREGDDPDAPDTRPVEERMTDIEEALKLKREVWNKFRDALANVCSGSPSRKELGQINEIDLKRFLSWVGGLLNPNV